MPVTKRISKIVSYNEQDDDDFIPIVDKNRINKSSKQPEKIVDSSKSEQTIIENTNIQSTDDSKISDVDDDEDENLSPKNKRIKHDEEEIITSEPDQSNCSIQISDLPKRNSSVPLGFPTSKINIPSPHVSRVGLSRKSLTIKPLHPNFASRIIPE